MISPFFPWFLAFLLLIACVALLVLLLRYRDRSVRLEAESGSWGLQPVSESLKLVQSRLGEMEKERVGAYTDLKTQIRYILSGNEALKNETARLSQALHHDSVRGQWFHRPGNPFQGGGTGAAGHGHSPSWRPFHHH